MSPSAQPTPASTSSASSSSPRIRPASPAASALERQTASAAITFSSGARDSTMPVVPHSSVALRMQSSSSSLRPASLTPPLPSPAATVVATAANLKAPPAVFSSQNSEDERIWKSPAARKAERTWKRQTEKTLATDSRFKKYAASIDRALGSFDAVNEWADFVGALVRLEKVSERPPPNFFDRFTDPPELCDLYFIVRSFPVHLPCPHR